MRRLLLILLLFAINSFVFSQNEYWVKVTDSSGAQKYINQEGLTMIPCNQYKFLLTDTVKHFAFVFDMELGLIAINKEMQVLFKPFLIDNLTPDRLSEGLFRIVIDNMIGFSNEKGEIVIPPKFESVKAFQNNIAAFCDGCKMQVDTITGYGYWTGGKWGFINKNGEVIVGANYDDVGYWKNELVVKKGESNFKINNKGLIIEKLSPEIKPWFH